MADTTSLKLPEDLKDRVGKVALRVEQTPHAYMVQAIAEKVERDEKRQAFLDSARQSRDEFRRTGIAYKHEDVMRYMKEVVAGKKPGKPKPIRVRRKDRQA
jgi:predicted transcriptional regulator